MADTHPETGGELEELMLLDEPGFRDVMSCVFGVQNHEVRTYLALLERPESSVEELAAVLDRDRSNINRSLSTLREKGLIKRERRLLDGGGYVYQYTAIALPKARELMHETVDAWAEKVHERIDEFDGQ